MDDCCSPKIIKSSSITPCPTCGTSGEKVSSFTIEKLLMYPQELLNEAVYYLCFNSDCDVAYYNSHDDNVILTTEIKVPIWFKKEAEPKYICYCSKVTEDEIVDAIQNKGCKTVKDVVANTNAMKISNCKENSPTGKCCSRQINDLLRQLRDEL